MGRKIDNFTPLRTDGLGNEIVDNAWYYVQDSRSYVGNCMLFWAKNRAGYCCDLKDAGLYTGDDVKTMRGTDVPWPKEWVEAHTITHVRGDTQAFDRTNYKPGPR